MKSQLVGFDVGNKRLGFADNVLTIQGTINVDQIWRGIGVGCSLLKRRQGFKPGRGGKEYWFGTKIKL